MLLLPTLLLLTWPSTLLMRVIRPLRMVLAVHLRATLATKEVLSLVKAMALGLWSTVLVQTEKNKERERTFCV